MFCLMKLQLYISSLTNRKMIDTVVMCLGCLCSLTLCIYFLFYGNFRCTTKSKGLSRTNRMDQIYFHKKKLVVNIIQFKNIELVGRFSDKYFSFKLGSCNKSLVFIKCFKRVSRLFFKILKKR